MLVLPLLKLKTRNVYRHGLFVSVHVREVGPANYAGQSLDAYSISSARDVAALRTNVRKHTTIIRFRRGLTKQRGQLEPILSLESTDKATHEITNWSKGLK